MKQVQLTTARFVALDILTKVDVQEAYSNLELKAALREHSFTRQDKGLITELVYGTISRRNTLDYLLQPFIKKPLHKLDAWVRNLLRISIYQLYYLDRIPERAIVHAAVDIAKKKGHTAVSGFINGVLREAIRKKIELEVPEQWPKFKKIAIMYSHPEWLVKRWLGTYGEKHTIAMCEMNNKPPMISLRVNELKSDRQAVIDLIRQDNADALIEVSALTDVGLHVQHVGNIAGLRAYREGYCTVQDESSMLVARAVDPKPGMRVLDLCAAPGGKTTHMAERMQNKGVIRAFDVHPHKLGLIEDNAKRLGITIIETEVMDATQLPPLLAEDVRYERILLDAPCSGFGVIRRKPDLKWNKTEQDIVTIARLQYELLTRAVSWLADEGKLVYSTCTIDAEENGRLVNQFLDAHPDFELDATLRDDLPEVVRPYVHQTGGYVQILPHYFGSDGFFICRIKRKQ